MNALWVTPRQLFEASRRLESEANERLVPGERGTMADRAEPVRQEEMSDEEIRKVFETLNLPTNTQSLPTPAQQPTQPFVFVTISGHTPPLNSR
jgi:hypothetical protein